MNKLIPSICLDDFYDDPLAVRELALKQVYEAPADGAYPGKRTTRLDLIDKALFDSFCKKVFSIFYDFNVSTVNWNVETSFQLIEPYENREDSIFNHGWIHIDAPVLFAGIIYLTPDCNPNCGTSLFDLVDPSKIGITDHKAKFYSNNVIKDDYEKEFLNVNSAFEETVTFKNKFNRMVCFDGNVWHRANNFYTTGEPRLTQVFFVHEFSSNSQPPILRCKNF